jgi:ABC-type multidrug transport system fused ATPase/permease subunit
MGVFDVCKHVLKVGFFIGILFIGIYLITKGEMTGGNVLAIVLLFQQLITPIDEFYRILDEISACSVKADILNDIMSQKVDTAFEIPDGDNAFDESGIVFDHYEVLSPGEEKILSKSNNAVFQTDKSTALVARTGGGKSSLMKGLVRLYPHKGVVKLFGVDLENISQLSLVQFVHYIPQSPFFFAGTVRDNLTYGLPMKPSDEDLIIALTNSCIYDELLNLSLGYPTPLDYTVQENGKNLSGGQLKRLAISRAFLRSPKIYVLDETLANIDEQTIKAILTNFESYARRIGAGIVHISHEPCIVSRCDKTVKLEPVL